MRSRLLAYQALTDEPATDVRPPDTTQGESTDRCASETPSSRLINLCSRLFLGANPMKVVAIVSCKPREGVTHVSRALHNFLTFDMSFSSTLLTAGECLHTYRSEKSHPPAASLFAPESGPARFLHAASLENRVVLIDCPPLCSSAAVLSLAPYVDGILLVVEDGKRSKAEIYRAVNTINAAQVKIVGIVLNRRRYVLPNWLYSLINH
jgi:Mrp family chromosome partitioning ATPase